MSIAIRVRIHRTGGGGGWLWCNDDECDCGSRDEEVYRSLWESYEKLVWCSIGGFYRYNLTTLSVLRRFRKIAKSQCGLLHFFPYVLPPVRIEQLGSHWTDFHEISYEGWNFNSGNYLFTTDTK